MSIILSSCVTMTRDERFSDIDTHVQRGEYGAAIRLVENDERGRLYGDRERVLYHLDRGMLHHFNGDFAESTRHLTEAEHLIEDLFTRSIADAASALLLNDTMVEYSGEEYEDVYLNIFKALNFIELGAIEPAFVEVRRAQIKLDLLEDKYARLAHELNKSEHTRTTHQPGSVRFHNSALARYISLLLYRNERNWDSVRIDRDAIDDAFTLQPSVYDFPRPKLDGLTEPTDKARLNVFGFAGRSPTKQADALYIITDPDYVTIAVLREGDRGRFDFVGIDRLYFPGVAGGYRFKFELPRIALRDSRINAIRVAANGRVVGELEPIESLANVARETFEVRQPIVYTRTITRTIVKGVLAAEGKRRLETAGASAGGFGALMGIVASVATDVAVDASEKADLRISRFFPAHAYVAEFHLEPGVYDITVEYYDTRGRVVFVDRRSGIEIAAGNLNVLSSYSFE